MTTIKTFLILSIIAYIGATLYLYLTQESKIFHFDIVPKKEPKVLKNCPKCKRVKLKVKDGLLDGVYLDNSSKKLIIYFGGNADDATDFIEVVKDIKGFDIVAFNYRGNGLSEGTPSQKALYEDALVIYDKFAKDKDIYVIGRSLGSGVATYLASKREVKKLFLITPYDSIENVAKEKYPIFPISLLLKYKFNSKNLIEKVKSPIVIFMIKGDKVVSNRSTKNLIKHIRSNYALKILEHTTHADILSNENFIKEIRASILNPKS